MRLGTDTANLFNHLMAGSKQPEPEVGLGATVLAWTDRYAGTIIETEKRNGAIVAFTVQEDIARRTDTNGMSESQNYEYVANPYGTRYRFRRVSRGKLKGAWRENGKSGGLGVLIGTRAKFHDYSF